MSVLFREHFEEAIEVRQVHPRLPIEVTVQFVVSGLLSTIAWWIENDAPYTAEEMNAMFQRLMRNGVLGALHASAIDS